MNEFRRFMRGRYGLDMLGYVLLIAAMVFSILRRLLGWWGYGLCCLVLFVIAALRILSRNPAARYRENQRFLQFWQKARTLTDRAKAGWQARKTHRFYRCPQCKKRLRVPRGRGKIKITCPYCNNRFIKKT